ncbi:MAG: methyltransferase domain-containing protein [archaeon]|nr:methyltransferase domain-containing protein [archaeon]
MSNENLKEYYATRAKEYEKIYLKPERQNDLKLIRNKLKELFTKKDVLEIACGTGYWTKSIAKVARSIEAVDINSEVLEIAKTKGIQGNISFIQDDVFLLKKIKNKYNAGFGGFWWSHLLKSQIQDFIKVFNSKFQPGALVVFIDNNYVEGSNTPISKTDNEGNTYQIRQLESGKTYEVVKNFPKREDFEFNIKKRVENLKIEYLTYYWIVSYNIK